jgi:hypothetical protein
MTLCVALAADQDWNNSCPLRPPPSSMNHQAMQAVPLAVEVALLTKDACLEVVVVLRDADPPSRSEYTLYLCLTVEMERPDRNVFLSIKHPYGGFYDRDCDKTYG